MANGSLKAEHPLERRQTESARIREKYPERIPVIVEKADRTDIPDIDKKKLHIYDCHNAEGLKLQDDFDGCHERAKTERATINTTLLYLVPADLTVGQLVYVIRKRIKLSPEKAIFIFVKNVLPPTGAMMSTIYEEHKDEDGFLYMTYSGENTFGSP